MTVTITPAVLQDVAELRQLYFEVYGHGYPVPLGSDPAEMRRLITDPHTHWLVARKSGAGELAGSVVVQTEPGNRIGKIVGLAVHPVHREGGLAGRLTGAVCTDALATRSLDSIYATVRVVTEGPQHVVVRNGFRPLGLMANAVEVAGCESLALFARFADDVLNHREHVPCVPAPLAPLLTAVEETSGIGYASVRPIEAPGTGLLPGPVVPSTAAMEIVTARHFVNRRFLEQFPDPAGRFFPLHSPNAILTPENGEFEAYADLDPVTGSCSLIAVHPYPAAMAHALEPLMTAVTRTGVDYVETLLPLSDTAGLSAFLAAGFVPSALYPAMRRVGDRFHDYVVLSRTNRQIDFRATAVSSLVQPYLSAYLRAWTATYLPLHEVVS
ncbi:ribosomal protein S18 acetylase RimI-like enzyme [Streptomyces sp. Amel2xB2]|uniref:GNAT family N-acetyltransferase n=1 Tax=Streptomyces sp. Amel2xB2 TaxID=1305829 RepID=UPI000DBAC478|nr:GNAT family N-acetyltransferase [Streptomyces sp. Amel2xB2]RAJ58330.1 ribosomal protein S18 acetylase RimI-like enzyme [Streptomyces sp. Amel2xB2]